MLNIFKDTTGATNAVMNVGPRDTHSAMVAGILAHRELKKLKGNEDKNDILSWAKRSFSRRSNPIVPGVTDIQPWLFYDRLVAAASTSPSTTLMFFTTPLSATKTKLDTNLKQAGRLPDPKHFLVMAIRFIFDSGMSATDINLMIKSYYIEFVVGDKIFAEGHFDMYPGGAGLEGFAGYVTSAAGTTGNVAVNNGFPSPLATNNWGKEHGIHILQGQNFNVNAVAPQAVTLGAALGTVPQYTPGLNVRCVLDGILYREAQ